MSPAVRIIILIASFCVEPFCQILISASGQISTPTVCSVGTCSLESANYLFCRLDIKDAGHSRVRLLRDDPCPKCCKYKWANLRLDETDTHSWRMLRKSSGMFYNYCKAAPGATVSLFNAYPSKRSYFWIAGSQGVTVNGAKDLQCNLQSEILPAKV